MGILDDLLGGGQRRQDYTDFVRRYDQGHPSEGYSDQEVMDRYRDVAHAVPRDEYAQAAQEALARLSPEERAGFVKMLQQRAEARGVPLSGNVSTNPRDLGQVLTNIHETPGRLRDLFGSGGERGGTQAAGGGTQAAGGGTQAAGGGTQAAGGGTQAAGGGTQAAGGGVARESGARRHRRDGGQAGDEPIATPGTALWYTSVGADARARQHRNARHG